MSWRGFCRLPRNTDTDTIKTSARAQENARHRRLAHALPNALLTAPQTPIMHALLPSTQILHLRHLSIKPSLIQLLTRKQLLRLRTKQPKPSLLVELRSQKLDMKFQPLVFCLHELPFQCQDFFQLLCLVLVACLEQPVLLFFFWLGFAEPCLEESAYLGFQIVWEGFGRFFCAGDRYGAVLGCRQLCSLWGEMERLRTGCVFSSCSRSIGASFVWSNGVSSRLERVRTSAPGQSFRRLHTQVSGKLWRATQLDRRRVLDQWPLSEANAHTCHRAGSCQLDAPPHLARIAFSHPVRIILAFHIQITR